jgi:hypothetical protein
VLHTGKVLMFGGTSTANSINTAAYLFDPVTRTGKDVAAPAPVWCGSVTQLSDGRVLSVGGANPWPRGIKDVYLFDPVSEEWVRQPDTPLGRYYPTSTRLPDGTVLIAAGTQPDGRTPNPKIEIYTPPAVGSRVGSLAVVGPDHATPDYPHQWVMPDGKLLQVASARSYLFDPAAKSWTTLRTQPVDSTGAGGLMVAGPASGSNTVMLMGGRSSPSNTRHVQKYDHATNTWTRTVDMPTARAHMNVVQVPDGTAIGIGGNSSGLSAEGQYAAMSYDPRTDKWTELASQAPRRAYHSTAVLLPDGRIMSAGDDKAGGGAGLIDFYSPPYLFAGPRPTITAAPTQVDHGRRFTLDTSGATVTRAVLVAPGATTHTVDMNTRHVELALTSTGNGAFTATAPTAEVAPPGHYMMFALTAAGVPSVATWVHVSGQAPDPPAGVVARSASREATLAWRLPISGAGSPPTGYQVQRGTSITTRRDLSPSRRSYRYTRLTNGHRYRLYVRARNTAGVSRWVSATATPARRPYAPAKVRATAWSHRARLYWGYRPGGNGGAAITGYQVQRGSDRTRGRVRSRAARSQLFTRLTNGRAYTLHVRARNRVGYGPWARATARPRTASR